MVTLTNEEMVLIAQIMTIGLCGTGHFDDWSEIICDIKKELGEEYALQYAKELDTIMTILNPFLPDNQQPCPIDFEKRAISYFEKI